MVTDFPVMEALGTPQPGVYVMSARAADDLGGDESYDTRATQWFVVSDLGLTALSAPDGVTVLVRSLADAAPKPGVEVRLLAKNNEVLATSENRRAGGGALRSRPVARRRRARPRPDRRRMTARPTPTFSICNKAPSTSPTAA